MALSMNRELDSTTKLFTALGFGDKQATEPFLDSARSAAWSQRTDAISLNSSGQAVADSTVDGKSQPHKILDFGNSQVSLPKSMHYDVAVNSNEKAHVDLSADIFGSGNSFHVVESDKTIDGTCSTKNGITDCTETIKDSSGNPLLKGHTTADIVKDPADFHRTTTFTNPANEILGTVSQHIKFDKASNTMVADATLTRK